MDSRTLVLVLLVCLIFLHDASGLFPFLSLLYICRSCSHILTITMFSTDITHANANFHALPIRKMMVMEKENEWGGANGNEELRTVPSGPDPLHHHVNPPRQPRTDSHLP
ncbi:protein CLAVATA 3-like isoform X1 [Raphanus sativus]|uniref:Protein CLAVATA 3-like isoform X1 n=1 Tax=Raphanus sativus TaxID=3726 RepID=A0A9W3D3B7_RAPSA|nr:protein CLAVATA 3-like isoform X1 [Raphanus sativus]